MSDHDGQDARMQNELSRRALLGGAAALGATAALPRLARAQTPRRGGHLILGLENASSGDTLDPGRLTGRYIIVVGLQLYDTLVDVDEQLRAKPALAESWAAKPGAREWVFKIRRGVTLPEAIPASARDRIPDLLTPGAAEALAVKIYRATRTGAGSPQAALADALDDYQPPVRQEILEAQIILAVREATDLSFVPERFRTM